MKFWLQLRLEDFLYITTHISPYQRKSEFQLGHKVILSETVGWKDQPWVLGVYLCLRKISSPGCIRLRWNTLGYITFYSSIDGTGVGWERKEKWSKVKNRAIERQKRQRNLLITGLSEQDIFLPFHKLEAMNNSYQHGKAAFSLGDV